MNNIWEKVKPWLTEIVSCTAFCVAIYLVAWVANGIKGTHFDLSNLTNFYLMVKGKQQMQHGIDSIFNSNRGESLENKILQYLLRVRYNVHKEMVENDYPKCNKFS